MSTKLSRRGLIASGAFALAGCTARRDQSGLVRNAQSPVVSVIRQAGYTQDIYET
ncbi:MAG: hypothetical protein QOJ99_3138, partial [Bryobacterales bacterium]|nr:hypothetical protein [Bryobacterales bacterium]